MKSEEHYTDGILEGWFIKYYENGNLKREGNYKDGVKFGLWKYYKDYELADEMLWKGEL